ncbi:MAG TPA: glucokinase [Hyphomicrobium sp.]
MSATDWGLVGDIGATNARFALVAPDGTLGTTRVLLCDDYPTIADAIAAYLKEATGTKPAAAVLAVAATPAGDAVSMTNHPWAFSIEALRQTIGLERLKVVNDFHANAAVVPYLAANERTQVGPGAPVSDAPIGVIGPGTGLGVSALVPTPNGPMPIPGEGGHVTMSPADARESAVLEVMRERYDHVSAERVLSGPGLVNLYNTLCELSHVKAAPFTAAQVTDPKIGAADACAHEATAMFCAMLGTIAGNLALTLGARGGIYIAGGIVPKLADTFAQSQFRERFEAKGRFRDYLAEIPTYVIVRPFAALLGAAKLLDGG